MCNRLPPTPPAATIALSSLGLLILTTGPAAAYIGPGAGLSAIGAALALVAAVGLAVLGFLWYPAKRLTRRLFGKPAAGAARTKDARPDTPVSKRPPA
jgi:hypothetical protein